MIIEIPREVKTKLTLLTTIFLTFLSSAAAAVSLLPLKPPDKNGYNKKDTVKGLAWLFKENARLERPDMSGPNNIFKCEYSFQS